MMRSIFLRTLFDKRWFVLGWTLAMTMTAILMVAMYPSLKEGMEQIIATMPPQLQGLAGDINAFNSLESYLASQLFDIRVPLLLMIMAAILATSLTVTAEEKGQLRTVLSGRYSRASWYIQTWYAALIVTLTILAFMTAAVIISTMAIGDNIPWWTLLQLNLMTMSFIMMTFTFIYALGASTNNRAITLGIGMAVIILSFILDAGSAVDWLEPFQVVSLLNYFNAGSLVSDGISIVDQLIVLTILLVSYVVGLVIFRLRDIQ